SVTLFGLSRVCRNLTDLEVNNCDEETLGFSGLICFIKMQSNLQSLYLHFDHIEEQGKLLSDVIEGKAATLKRLTLRPIVTSISPKFLPSLTKLQYLALN